MKICSYIVLISFFLTKTENYLHYNPLSDYFSYLCTRFKNNDTLWVKI